MSEVKQPIFDIIILVLVIAIIDGVFRSNVCSVEDIFRTCVSPLRRSLKLDFKLEKLNVPIYR
jgi:hypothetical protein